MSHVIQCLAYAVAAISARSPRKPRRFTPSGVAAGRQPAYYRRVATASSLRPGLSLHGFHGPYQDDRAAAADAFPDRHRKTQQARKRRFRQVVP